MPDLDYRKLWEGFKAELAKETGFSVSRQVLAHMDLLESQARVAEELKVKEGE